jgi:hypothetical protein
MPKTSFGSNPSDDAGYDRDWINGVRSGEEDGGSSSGAGAPNDLGKAEENSRGSRLGNALKYGSDAHGADGKSLFNNAAGAGGPGGAGGLAKKLAGAMQKGAKSKKGQGGIVGVLAAVVLMFGISSSFTHELKFIGKMIQQEEAKVATEMEQKMSSRVLDNIVQRALKNSTSAAEKAAAKQAAQQASEEGRTVAETVDTFKVNEELWQKFMEKANLHMTFNANGDLTGILDSTGKNVANDVLKNNASFERFLSEAWGVDQIEGFRPSMEFDSGTSFNVFPEDGSKDENPKKTLNDAVKNGASAEEIAQAQSEENKTPPDENASEADRQSYQSAEERAGVLEAGIEAAEKNFEQTNDAVKANEAGVKASMSKFDSLNNKLFWAGIATEACTLEQETVKAADSRVATILTLLARAGVSNILSLGDEIVRGKVSSKTVNTVMLTLQGNSDLLKQWISESKTNKDAIEPQGAMPFTRAAGWHRVTHQTVDSNPKSPYYTPDISDAARPTRKAGSDIADNIQRGMNAVGANFACAALTSKAGVFIQIGAGAAQIISNIGDFGATQLAVLAGSTALIETLNRVVMPQVIAYFTNTSVTGTNEPVQNINNGDAGIDFSYSNWGRRLGGVPQTNASTKKLRENAANAVAMRQQRQPWVQRTFAMDNPNSLAAKLMMQIPLGTQATFASMASWFTTFPSGIAHQISSIFTPKTLFADGPGGCVDAYCITAHALPDSIIDQYDPVENESYLFSKISYGGKDVRRIDALGNINTYQDGPAGDSNNDDLMHCFVDPHPMLMNLSDGTNDAARKNCGSIGSYDMNYDDPNSRPTVDTVAGIYCKALVDNYDDGGCRSSVKGQMDTKSEVDNEFYRYAVYLGTTQVTKTLKSMQSVTN